MYLVHMLLKEYRTKKEEGDFTTLGLGLGPLK